MKSLKHGALLATAVSVVGILFLSKSSADASGSESLQVPPNTQVMSMHVTCSLPIPPLSTEFKLDAAHKVTFSGTYVDNGVQVPFETTVYYPAHSTAQGVADLTAFFLNEATGKSFTAQETNNPNFQDEEGKKSTQDVVIPNDVTVDKIDQVKQRGDDWVDDDGRLQLFQGNTRDPFGNAPIGSGNYQSYVFSNLDLTLYGSTADPLGIEFILHGFQPSAGIEFVRTKTHTFPSGTPLPDVISAIGSYASSLGMTVSYPTPNSVSIDPGTSDYQPFEAWFTAWEDNTNILSEYSVGWSFSAQ